MKRLIFPLACLSILLLACSITTTATPTVIQPSATKPPVIIPTGTETPTEVPTVTLVPTETPLVANVTCHELSFYLDPALASSSTCETVPEVLVGIMTNPQYTLVTLQGYGLAHDYHTANIAVLPMTADYKDIAAQLQALIAGGAPGQTLPYFLQPPAAEEFYAQYQIMSFTNGNGIRYLTQFVQMTAPVDNQDMIYTFQGLTSDGKYWVSVTMPDSHPSLPATSNDLPGGESWDQFQANFDTYIADLKVQLNAFPADTFQPSLDALDKLVSSITVQP